MGAKNGPYKADFPVGTRVRIRDRGFLEEFKKNWKYHNPIRETQLEYAGKMAMVISVGYYFGGDELYYLESIPGIWHEVCLEDIGA